MPSNQKPPHRIVPTWVSWVFNHKHLTALLTTLAFSVFIVPINESIAFTSPTDKRSLFLAVLLKAGFALFLYVLLFFALEFAQRVAAGNKMYRQWLRYSLIYLAIMTVVFVLIYPGHWVWDEFNILNSVKHYLPDFWQSSFTYIFYAFSLYIFPTGVTIIALQILLISIIVGYVISRFSAKIKYKYAPLVLFILFLLPPIIVNNFYPLRMPLYSYLELLFLGRFVLLYFDGFKPANKYRELLFLSFLIMMLSFWRTESAYYLLFLPALVYLFKIFTKQNIKRLAPYMVTLGSVAIIAGGGLLTLKTTDSKYSLTTFVNPLTVVLQMHLKGKNLDQNLAAIDKVLILQKMREHPSYTEIVAFWDHGVRDDYKAHLPEFYKAYAQLVKDNPGPFLYARTKTFLSANGLEKTTPSSIGLLVQTSYSEQIAGVVANRFYATNLFAHPISLNVKRKVTQFLQMTNDMGYVQGVGKIVWSILPVLAGLLVLFVYSLVRKHWMWTLLTGLVLARIAVLFVTAPAHYFMYYLPVYISGYFVLLLSLLLYLDNKKRKTKPAKA